MTQSSDEKLVGDLEKSSQAVYLACEAAVADDISSKLKQASTRIRALVEENERLKVRVLPELQPIETAPMGEHGNWPTHFIGAAMTIRQGSEWSFARCYRTKDGAFEWWGGGMTPTHWMPLPAINKTGEKKDV